MEPRPSTAAFLNVHDTLLANGAHIALTHRDPVNGKIPVGGVFNNGDSFGLSHGLR